jgi:hypothetical protein
VGAERRPPLSRSELDEGTQRVAGADLEGVAMKLTRTITIAAIISLALCGAGPRNRQQTPDAQAAFCKLLREYSTLYTQLERKRRRERNRLVKDRLRKEQTSLQQERDKALNDLLMGTNFQIELWRVKLQKITTPTDPRIQDPERRTYVFLQVDALCNIPVTIQTSTISLTPESDLSWAARKIGTNVFISGRFEKSERENEWLGRGLVDRIVESDAMDRPFFNLTDWGLAAP